MEIKICMLAPAPKIDILKKTYMTKKTLPPLCH